jgi:hypothetical protein
MRSAVLHLAFAELDCVEARTMSFTGNAASLSVSQKLGYGWTGSHATSWTARSWSPSGYGCTDTSGD